MSAGVNRLVPSVEQARGRYERMASTYAISNGEYYDPCWGWDSNITETASVALDMAVAAESDRRRGRAA